jgi:hypothetical protein
MSPTCEICDRPIEENPGYVLSALPFRAVCMDCLVKGMVEVLGPKLGEARKRLGRAKP